MQVGLVKAKVVVGEKTFESRENFDIVVIVNSVNIAATIVDGSFQLTCKKTSIKSKLIALIEHRKQKSNFRVCTYTRNNFCCWFFLLWFTCSMIKRKFLLLWGLPAKIE